MRNKILQLLAAWYGYRYQRALSARARINGRIATLSRLRQRARVAAFRSRGML